MADDLRNIDRIIVRYLLDEADQAEMDFLLNWLKEDSANLRYYFVLKDTWILSHKNPEEKIATRDAWRSLKSKMEQSSEPVVTKQRSLLILVKYAAAILFLAVLGFAAYKFSDRLINREPAVTYTEIVTENGQKKEIDLPDGTKIWLNSGTKFRYASDYGKVSREVSLTGEAFFDVRRDESKTFVVKAGDLTIKVLGTSFNVNCYPENRVVETTVISGIVSIENDDIQKGSEIVILNKHEKGTYVKDQQKMLVERNGENEPAQPLKLKKITLNEEQSTYISSWKDQTLSFDNETLEEMAIKLERWFNVSIRIGDERLKDYRYKGKFENVRSIYQVLEVVKLATPITWEYNEKTNEITIMDNKN